MRVIDPMQIIVSFKNRRPEPKKTSGGGGNHAYVVVLDSTVEEEMFNLKERNGISKMVYVVWIVHYEKGNNTIEKS